MLVKNNDAIVATTILRTINTTKCGVKLAFKAQCIIDKVNEIIKTIESVKARILENEIQLDKDGNKMYADPEKKYFVLTDKGTKELNELMSLETNIDIEPFTIDELDSFGIAILPAETHCIRWLIK